MIEYTTEQKVEYFQKKFEAKVIEHQNKYPTFDSGRLYNWIIDKTKDKTINKQLWSLKYYCKMNISDISKKIRSENSLARWTSKDNL